MLQSEHNKANIQNIKSSKRSNARLCPSNQNLQLIPRNTGSHIASRPTTYIHKRSQYGSWQRDAHIYTTLCLYIQPVAPAPSRKHQHVSIVYPIGIKSVCPQWCTVPMAGDMTLLDVELPVVLWAYTRHKPEDQGTIRSGGNFIILTVHLEVKLNRPSNCRMYCDSWCSCQSNPHCSNFASIDTDITKPPYLRLDCQNNMIQRTILAITTDFIAYHVWNDQNTCMYFILSDTRMMACTKYWNVYMDVFEQTIIYYHFWTQQCF